MKKLQLLYSGLLGILGATVAFLVFSMTQIQAELDTVTKKLVNTNKAFVEATAKIQSKDFQPTKDPTNNINDIKSILGDLVEQIVSIDKRLNVLDTDLSDVQNLLANNSEEQITQEYDANTMAATSSAYTPDQQTITPEAATAMLEYALTDPITEDPIWSDNTRIQVEEIFAQSPSLKIATSYDVTCGGQLCKIKTTLPSDATFIEKEFFDMNLTADLSPMMDRSILQANLLPDGTTEFTHYVARKGHYLPTEGGGLTISESEDGSDG